jgi:hypothetical protein
MALSKRQAGVLLGALWTGDGHAGVRKNGTPRLVYASRSRGLCLDVKALLARVGIAATVTNSSVSYKGERRGYYFTTIVGTESKLAFITAVQAGHIPVLELDTVAIEAACRRAGARGRNAFRVEQDVMWDTVESCLFVGKERCYDIEVPGNHTFVAEGLVTHNTSGRISPELGSRYALSGQFLGMANFGQQVFGTDFGGVVINIIGCGPADGYSALGSSKFDRQEPPPAPHAQKLFTFSVLHARERIEALDASGLDPWKWPKTLSEQACVTAYGKCDGFELCRWGQP